jgi:hypothetical protein
MARAAHRLYRSEAPWQDLRLPIAAALLDTCGSLTDVELADFVEVMLPIEQRELLQRTMAPAGKGLAPSA